MSWPVEPTPHSLAETEEKIKDYLAADLRGQTQT